MAQEKLGLQGQSSSIPKVLDIPWPSDWLQTVPMRSPKSRRDYWQLAGIRATHAMLAGVTSVRPSRGHISTTKQHRPTKWRYKSTSLTFTYNERLHSMSENQCSMPRMSHRPHLPKSMPNSIIHPSIHVYFSEKSNQKYGTYISTIKIWMVQQDTVVYLHH